MKRMSIAMVVLLCAMPAPEPNANGACDQGFVLCN